METATISTRLSSCVGELLSGRYRVTSELGRGGFATVYLAQDEKLVSKPVVVKVLSTMHADHWATRKFHQEIEAMARIDHPGVVTVLDEGQTSQGTPFLVMQFVDGVTLRKLIQPGGMDLRRAAAILQQTGSALGAAHAKGVFHRDLKPENIMVQSADGEPRVKLIDFGIAGIQDSLFAQADQSTRIAGTYRYMAPEQLEGRVCQQSDIYAFGAIAYEILTGASPVKSPMELIAMKVEGLKVKPRGLRPELPEAVEPVILKALAFEVADRYSDAREMGDRLAAALLGHGQPAETPTARTQPPPAQTPAERLEIAHVMFLDLVGFSTRTMEDQRSLLDALQTLVRQTPHFVQAEKAGELIALPTGDGMALVFFGNPIPAAECALEVARAVRANPAMQLRMGVHSGPVYRVADVNKNLNVTGGGINMAQRVMDAGDAGHILVSGTAAETLTQFGGWKDRLSDLGDHPVKHGAVIHFFNLCAEDAGNPVRPSKWATAQAPPAAKSRRGLAAGVLVVAALAGVGIYVATRPKEVPAKPIQPVVAAPAAPALQLEYSGTLLDGKATIPFVGGETMLFRKGDQAALTFQPVQAGFLYLLDDGPMPDGSLVINVLRPAPGASAGIPAGQRVRIPSDPEKWLHFDDAKGEEKVYLIFSAKPVAELEAIKDQESVVSDEPRLASLRGFLAGHVLASSGIKKDEDAKKTVLSTNDSLLVHRIRLQHH